MFKKIPHLLKSFLRPMLLISLGMHVAVLLIPLSTPPKQTQKPKPKTIKIAKIPILRASPKPLVRQPKPQKLQAQNIPPSIPSKGMVLRQNPTKATTLAKAQTKSESKPSGTPSDSSSPRDEDWRDLPAYSNKIQPCEGREGCVQTEDTFDAVTQYFEAALLSKKIKFSKDKPKVSYDSQYTTYKVFNKKGKVQFLSILGNGANTKYVWADRIASEEEIVTRTSDSTDIATLIGQLSPQFIEASKAKLSPDRFPEADVKKFYIDPDPKNPVYKNIPAENPTIVSSDPINTYQTLSGKLSSSNYSAQVMQGGYGSGSLYEITKPSQTKPLYVTIIATRQGDGSIVALWLDMPR